jgi:hypothetical protein
VLQKALDVVEIPPDGPSIAAKRAGQGFQILGLFPLYEQLKQLHLPGVHFFGHVSSLCVLAWVSPGTL